MENQDSSQVPPNPEIKQQPTAEPTPPPSQKPNNLLIAILSVVILFLLGSTTFFAYHYFQPKTQQTSPKTKVSDDTQITVPNTTQQTATSTPEPANNATNTPNTKNLNRFTDEEISGFSFQYDPKEWFIESNEDLKYCGGAGCSRSHGKTITVTHNQYKDFPKKVSLNITLSDEVESIDDNISICFTSSEIEEIGSSWFRAKNPSISTADEQRDSLWGRYFYRSSSVKQFSDISAISSSIKTSCDKSGISYYINGSLNITSQPTLPISYKEKPTILTVHLQNTVSPEMASIADNIVKTIQPTQ